jgi:predicted NUDIX family NTP pyrophosphohydrolase
MKVAAGILLYRFKNETPEVFLVHPGGPFWARKDQAAWSIPKGELNEGEDILEGAKREFAEETGSTIDGSFIALKPVKTSGKLIHVFALEHDFDPMEIASNLFSMEWPPRSGKYREFPEVDKGAWFDFAMAINKIHKNQVSILNDFQRQLELE